MKKIVLPVPEIKPDFFNEENHEAAIDAQVIDPAKALEEKLEEINAQNVRSDVYAENFKKFLLQKFLENKELSHREAEVMEQMVKGKTSFEAAKALFITEKTVKFHLTNIYKKLEVKSRTQAIIKILTGMGY